MNLKKLGILAVSLLTAFSLSFPALAKTSAGTGFASGKQTNVTKKAINGKKSVKSAVTKKKAVKKSEVKGKVKTGF